MTTARQTKESKGTTITVMGREFRVATPKGEESKLFEAVEMLNLRMKEIRDSGKVVGNERIAIMAALNIAHEHLQKQGPTTAKEVHAPASALDENWVKGKLLQWEETIEKALAEQERLFD